MSENDYIIELLNQADQCFGVEAKTDAAGLAEAVRGRYRLRQRRRKTAMGMCMVLLAVGLGWFGVWSGDANEPKQQIAAQQEYEQLSRQMQQTLAQLRELNAETRRNKDRAKLYREYAKITVQLESEATFSSEDRAALKLMSFADRLADEEGGREAKMRTYDKVIHYFPNSQYAETAKEKLVALRSSI